MRSARWGIGAASASAFLLAWLGFAPRAWAGRTAHLLTDEAQIVPEGDVELEQWIWGEGRVPSRPARPVITWIWWAPVVGVSPHLELAFPLQLVSGSEALALETVGIDARYRIFPRLQDEGWQPLVRVAYAHPLGEYGGAPRVELTGVVEYGAPSSVQLTLNLGGSWGLPFLTGGDQPADFFLSSAAAISVPLPSGLRLGAEVVDRAPLSVPDSARNVLYAGGSLSWTHGPFWITAGALFGLNHDAPRVFPKVLWAVEF